MELKIKIKKVHPNAVIPKYSRDGDGAVDLVCVQRKFEWGAFKYYSGIAVEIPEGYVGLLFPRSSISQKNQMMANAVGVIDSNYRGEICAVLKDIDSPRGIFRYEEGDRFAQLMIVPIPKIQFEEVSELSKSNRNTSGFGSSGK